ncbi:MAG: glycosyl transferase [Fibrobacter sp.]|nr:glycosyl transferase [Fibrobacter sp.]
MIPKIIHYCWLSNDPIPADLQKCMESWKKHLPDYDVILWNFERFPRGKSAWVDEAFDNRKFAFAADYIRLYALYTCGGVYLDMDVEVLKSFNEFESLNTMLCYENSKDGRLEVAAFGAEKESCWVKACLDHYENKHFVNEDGSFNTRVLPAVIRDCLIENNFSLKSVETVEEAKLAMENNLPVFPFDFFSPKSYATGKIEKTDRTYSIHHFAGTWLPWYCRLEKKVCAMLGITYRDFLHRHFAK